MTKQKAAYPYALATVLLWSTVASAFKISLRYLNVLPLLFYSAIVSTVVLFCCLLFQKRVSSLKTLTKRDYFHSAILGFLNPFLYYVVLIKAYSLLPAQQAQPLNFVWPITLVLLSIPLLKQKIKPISAFAVIISFFGVLVISTRGDIFGFRFTSPTGVILAVGSSVIWAVFWIYNVKDKRDEVVKLFLNFAFGSVFIFLSMLICASAEVPNFKGALGAVYIGLFEMGITFLLWLRALKLSRTTAHVANLIYLVPFLSLVVICFVVGEKILVSTIIGVVFIVSGIILQEVWGH
ncbi:MAG: DMT family transporter [Planctomycetota bacterium]|jgi:drug/metabolite transporter (DMT)-like permease